MNRNTLTDLVDVLKNLFIPREKKLVPVKVRANNKRGGF
jgi:hypothetical protein